ncbi:MAG: tetratricopeptide repeat protein [Planctomycetota bacterium]|jgi:hypothetical protein
MSVRECFWIGILMSASVVARADEPSTSAPNVFDLPQVQAKHVVLEAQIAALFKTGQYAEAEKRCRAAIGLIPHNPIPHYNLACALARQGRVDEALASLEKAVELGFSRVDQLKTDDDLASLREHERFDKAVDGAASAKPDPERTWRYQVTPAPIQDQVAVVDQANTAWDWRLGVFRSFFNLETAPSVAEPMTGRFQGIAALLAEWKAEGTVAGNRGDLYDNHDSDHSNMHYEWFPELTRIEFGEDPKARSHHHGLQTRFLYNGVTIGNSSSAVTHGLFWRSLPRLALANPRSAALLYVQYRKNHLYVYPEHRDHDPGHNGKDGGYGDVFLANTPYLIISQGSSGSDRAFLDALAATLAAFRPEVKSELARAGTLMPTVQMIFRFSNQPVTRINDYLTGKAHPTVFDRHQLDPLKMVRFAHGITRDRLPPLVRLKVVEEDQPVQGRDYFAPGKGEVLFNTPCAVARVVRTVRYYRRIVVSAEPSTDPNNRPLTYHWPVLRGDAERIEVNPLNEAGSVVELLIPYHQRAPVAPRSSLESNRVDVGAFVHNGVYYSAPAFVTFFFLDNEKRVYDDENRILVVDYADPEAGNNYVDPTIDAPKRWRDEYHYGASGEPTGWTRIRGESKEEFTAEGLLVSKTDASGRPTEGSRVRYVAKPRPKLPPLVEQQTTDDVVPIK